MQLNCNWWLFKIFFLYFCLHSALLMPKNKYHMILARILLLCFCAGQFMVYAHRHNNEGSAVNKSAYHNAKAQHGQTVTENCRLCDAMHHNVIAINSQTYFAPLLVSSYCYKSTLHSFISISLILSAGRSPPAV